MRKLSTRRPAPGEDLNIFDLFGIARPPDWTAEASCAKAAHPDAWWPEKGDPAAYFSAQAALRICRERCPVRDQCLQTALDNHEIEGIWGGTTPRQRRTIRRRHRQDQTNRPAA